jgi:DNA primase
MSMFDFLRDRVSLDQIVSANGSGKARCVSPDHQDEDPSMHLYDDHAHCFACGFHGDVTDVWAAMRGFDRPVEAALDLAGEFGIELPEASPEASQKARERRDKEDLYLQQAKACHGALSRHPCVAEWWEARGFGQQLRERFLLGTNKDSTAAVIPFWHRGRVQGLIRRKLAGEPRYILPKAEELPGGYRPLFVPGPLGREVFLVEGYIDALAIASTGKGAIAIGGTHISEGQSAELRKLPSEDTTIYILPDDDERGKEAARTWGREFFPQARVCPPSYGEGAKDIADTFAGEGAQKTDEHLMRLMATSKDMIDIETEVAADIKGGPREKLAYATQNIVPLLCEIEGDAVRDATADIVCDQVKGLKKSWITKAIQSELDRRFAEHLRSVMYQEKVELERRSREHQEKVADAQEEIDALLTPGVLGRLRDTAAAMHNVYGDKEPLELALLVALGAQLEPLPNGRPLGASILLTAQAGRGKNHIVDAAVKPLPPEFFFAFEIASGQSLYYKADEDPEFLKHTFAYPNEIEGAETLWEFLRPMLSKGQAKKIVTAKDADGNMTTREITVEGPVTIAIPTIRNKTDEQLQTRLLVAELPDYPGRVKEHSSAVSAQLLPDAATADYSREAFLWREGLRQLTTHRRVVFPLRHPDFALDDDQVSHGARLWANLLSVMVTHAWLEQRNRRLLNLGEGKVAIEAIPDDYAAAYRIFNKVCKRTVVNISDTHRKILNSLYDLQQQFPNRQGFTQREIAKEGKDVLSEQRVSQGSISNNKTFLITSAKLMKETEDGLALVEGAEPSWWSQDGIMAGLPTPEQVKAWWEDSNPDPDPPPKGADRANHLITEDERDDKADTYAERYDHPAINQGLITISLDGDQDQRLDSDHSVINERLISENALPKRDAIEIQAHNYVISPISDSGSVEPPKQKYGSLTAEQAERIRNLVREGMSETWARRTVLADGHPPGCGCEVCLWPSNAPISQGKLMKGA